MLAIANDYGNVDVRKPLSKAYVHIPGQRLGTLCKRLGIKYAEALVGMKVNRYGAQPVLDGVVISKRSEAKLQAGIEERERKRNSPAAIKRREQSAAARKAKQHQERLRLLDMGIDPDSRIAGWYRTGEMGEFEARLAAFKTQYRHEYTNYDQVLHDLKDRDAARIMAEEEPMPTSWDEYLGKYGFVGDIAESLSKTLQDPSKCHPVWFYKAVLAVEAQELPLEGLTYDKIREAIDATFPLRD